MNTYIVKLAVRIILIVGIICFFCPFVLVSCGGTAEEATGVELIIPHKVDYSSEDDNMLYTNTFLLIALKAGVAGLVLSILFKNHKKILLAVGSCSIVGVACLMLFRATFYIMYDLSDYRGMLIVQYQWGWYTALIAYALAAILAISWHCITNKMSSLSEDEPEPPSPDDSDAPESQGEE